MREALVSDLGLSLLELEPKERRALELRLGLADGEPRSVPRSATAFASRQRASSTCPPAPSRNCGGNARFAARSTDRVDIDGSRGSHGLRNLQRHALEERHRRRHRTRRSLRMLADGGRGPADARGPGAPSLPALRAGDVRARHGLAARGLPPRHRLRRQLPGGRPRAAAVRPARRRQDAPGGRHAQGRHSRQGRARLLLRDPRAAAPGARYL